MTGQPSRKGAGPSALKSPPTLHLHIQDLVLHGFGSINRHRIGEAMERELARLFLGQEVLRSLANSIAVDFLDGGVLKIESASAPESIGNQLAQAIHGTLKAHGMVGARDRRASLPASRAFGPTTVASAQQELRPKAAG